MTGVIVACKHCHGGVILSTTEEHPEQQLVLLSEATIVDLTEVHLTATICNNCYNIVAASDYYEVEIKWK